MSNKYRPRRWREKRQEPKSFRSPMSVYRRVHCLGEGKIEIKDFLIAKTYPTRKSKRMDPYAILKGYVEQFKSMPTPKELFPNMFNDGFRITSPEHADTKSTPAPETS